MMNAKRGHSVPLARARAGRASGTLALVLAVAVLVVVLAACATPAYAEVIRTDDSGYKAGYVCPYDYDEYGRAAALCEVLGYDWDSFSASTRQQILTGNNGDNAFHSALSNIRNIAYEPANDLVDVVFIDVLQPWSILYGSSRVWYYKLTAENYEAARDWVLRSSVHGSNVPDSGGGGSGDEDVTIGEYTYQIVNAGQSSGNDVYVLQNVNGSDTQTWDFSAIKSSISNRIPNIGCVFSTQYNANGYYIYSMAGLVDGVYVAKRVDNEQYYFINVSDENKLIVLRRGVAVKENNGIFKPTQTGADINSLNVSPTSPMRIDNISLFSGTFQYLQCGASGTVTPPYEPQPDTPEVTPDTPPEVGTDTPTNVQQPTTINVNLPDLDIDWPNLNFTNNSEAPTQWTDYTPWLRSIYEAIVEMDLNIQAIGRGLDSAIQNLGDVMIDTRTAISTASNNISNNIRNQVGWLRGALKDDMTAINSNLKQYLRSLFTWMGNRIYSIQRTWTTKTNDLLKKIYNRLGGGNTSPITDPDGGPWDWLGHLLGDGLEHLTDEADSLKEQIVDLLAAIISKFPFCIPWDIALALGLLGGEPVTPVIECEVPYWDDLSYTISVDLTPYDDAMGVMRNMELLGFAIYLMWRSRDIIDMIDPSEELTEGKK